MAGSAPSDKVKDKEYTNWLKVTLALYYMKSGLHTFIQSEVDCLHQTLVQKIYGGKTVPLPPCTMCYASHVQRIKCSGVWTFPNQCQSYCDVWLHELLALHTNPKSEKIYWNNCHIASWPFKPWECAKVFMPRGQLPSNVGPTECDAQAMLTMLANCKHFHQKLSQQGLSLTHLISTIRNKVMHDGEMKLSDVDRSTYIQQIIQLLEDPVRLKSIEDCKAAVGNILKINNDSLDVSFNLDNEMTGLRSAVNELRLEHGLQEKRILDTVDSLKEEYNQLQEQITKSFADVENRMDSIERSVQSVKEQTDNAQSQHETKHQEMQAAVTSNRARLDTVEKIMSNRTDTIEKSVQLVKEQTDNAMHQWEEKHQEMQASVTHMSANVMSHRAQLDTVEENVEIIYNRTDTIEKSVQSLKEETDMTLQQQEKKHQEMHKVVTSHEERLNKVEETLQTFCTESYGSRINTPTQMENNSGREMNERGEGMSKYNILETSAKRRPESDGLRQLKCQTENRLDTTRSLEYISTRKADEATKLFEEKRSIVISGNLGEGKTTIALYLIDNEIYRDRRVVVYCPDDWKAVDTDWVDIVVLEDIFGQIDLNHGYLQDWMVQLPIIQEHVDAGKLRVIITTRTYILSKVISKLGSIRLFSNDLSLTLSSEDLNNSEKMSILNKELQRHQRICDIDENEKENCISNFRGLMGFPQCCSLFSAYSDLFSRGPNFFKSPAKYFVENIRNLEVEQFLSLVFLFCNGEIYEEHLLPETMPESSKRLLEKLSLQISERKVSVTLLRDVYNSLLGLYFVRSTSCEFKVELVTRPCIRFSHAVVSEAVGQVLFDCFPEIVVKCGDSEYLYQRTYTAKDKDRTSQNVFIPESLYGLLAERMVHDVIEEGLKESVVKHAALKHHQFLMTLKDELYKGNRVRDFFSDKLQFNRHQDLIEGECITFLQHLLRSDDVLTFVYNQFLEFLECSHNINSTDCWQCIEKQRLLELALYYHHFEIADKLIAMNACYTYTSLCNAARHDDLSRVQSILEMLKRGQMFSPVCGVAKDALCRAFISGHQGVKEFLLQEGITLDERHLINIVKNGDKNVLMKVIEHLNCHDNWNPHLEKCCKHRYFFSPSQYSVTGEPRALGAFPYSIALYIAYCNKNFDMACHLKENGIIVSMDMLPGVVRYSSKEAVSRLIQALQDSGIWDSNHCDAVAALHIGYIQQNYDVCNLLILFRVSLTMENVPGIIVHQRAPFAKIVIQHLKDRNSWDPESSYAFQALEHAYCLQAYDVCDLLDKERVSVTMKHLPLVILRPFDFVKLAVIKLKKSNSWDPKCYYATIALEYAFSERKYNVCDLLIKKGVSLTMKNLPDVVCHYKASFESVQKAIEHLKHTKNWDQKSVYAEEALRLACRRQNYDMCDLLIQEGVPLTMKFLPCVEACDHVKKAIQHLKDNDSWDPKCDYAARALQYACRHNNDVCDLLIQEGVSPTMGNFPDLICNNQASIQSVKQAIKRLKDANTWNPKCDDASEAFKYAYIKDRNDVCDLLVQEGVSLKMKNLPTVVWVNNRSVKKAIQHLKDTDNWDPRCDDASKALQYAYIKESYDVCDLLVNEGVSLTIKNLSFTNKSYPSFVSVKKILQHLKDTHAWDTKSIHAREALAMAYVEEKYDVCVLLVQEGVALAMEDLSIFSQLNKASLMSLKKVMQHLKDTNNWDPKSIHASQALEYAYYKQAFGVCAVLVEEGVLLTMKNLPYVILEVETSTEPVIKVINQLKDSASWDPKSDYASLALAKAYATKKNDVCDLLIQEGISLTMKNIHNVVCKYNASVESVKKTIQHLKEVNNWDLKYDASEALENNYIKENYDVCDLLVKEGLSLTMKNLPNIICRRTSSDDLLMKIEQRLNNTVSWDPHDNASVTLANAYVSEEHDVCNLNLQEFESLRVKKFHGVVCMDKTTAEPVKKIIQHLKNTDNWNPKCDDASLALAKAYVHGKDDVCDLLVQEGVSLTMKNLVSVILEYNTSVDSAKKALKYLKDTGNWGSNFDNEYVALAVEYVQEKYDVCDLVVQEGDSLTMKILHILTEQDKTSKCVPTSLELVYAYVKEKYEVCDLLLKEGVSLTMMNFAFIIEKGKISFESVKKTIQHLKDTGNWDPECDHASTALGMAYFLEKYDVCDLLVQEKVLLKMMDLPIFGLLDKTSVGSVKKAIQHLKDSHNWDPKCDHASIALTVAYIQEKYDVCDLFVQEGVSHTMRTLAMFVHKYETSATSVEKIIKHLKDSDNWDPTCDDASKALATLYAKENFGMCDLLVQEGISLTMRNLAIVVQGKTTLEYFMKTLQYLKTIGNWNSRCDFAFLAAVTAYVQEKYDVFDTSFQEEDSQIMNNFPFVIQDRTSLEYVKKAIKHLKDTDYWNPKCDDASVALAIAYVPEKYDVFNISFQEEDSQIMNNLPFVIQDRTSLEYVKKAIKHLKDTDYWNPKCDDASVALAIAYVQEKYDVHNLLVQEGISLTVKNLAFVVQTKTVEFVKETIECLKDVDNWDPNCNDASLALEIAYVQEKYDVFNLLDQEGVSLTMRCLIIVMQQHKISAEFVKKTIKHLKDSDIWDPMSRHACVALGIAYVEEKHDLYNLIVHEGVILTMVTLVIVVEQNASVQTVMETIQNLKDIGNWNPECADASAALAISYIKKKFNVRDLLFQEGVSLTMMNLAMFIEKDKSSFESIQEAIQTLKDCAKWDPMCFDASHALAIAYVHENYDLCDLLINEGISLTMINLAFFLDTNKCSFESVKKTIQLLKNTYCWDRESAAASLTLAITYGVNKYDVCDLLIDEGISLKMRDLTIVVRMQTSIESVKKTIKHLKDNGNWDSRCADASQALSVAYAQKKYGTCDLLIQMGISLTLTNLTCVVAEGKKTSVKAVKRAMQHLKDNGNWDPTHNDAYNGLVLACVKDNYDMCDLLIQEGISLPMVGLSEVMLNKGSVESVKKAIQYLKDSKNWNSSCKDASNALVTAYNQMRYDVCDLLVQKGVSLTMENFCSVVEHDKASFESVKKVIKHLKDAGNWNPVCISALETLIYTFEERKFAIFFLLCQHIVIPHMILLILCWCAYMFYLWAF